MQAGIARRLHDCGGEKQKENEFIRSAHENDETFSSVSSIKRTGMKESLSIFDPFISRLVVSHRR